MRGSPSRRHGIVLTAAVAAFVLAGCAGARAPAGGFPGVPGSTPQTAHLAEQVTLREVIAGPIPATPVSGTGPMDRQSVDPAEEQTAALALDCAGPDAFPPDVDLFRPLVACADDLSERYVLGPEFLELGPTTTVELVQDGQRVRITSEPSASRTLTDYTGANVGKMIALVVGSRVLTAPTVNSAIVGPLEISGPGDDVALFRRLTGG